MAFKVSTIFEGLIVPLSLTTYRDSSAPNASGGRLRWISSISVLVVSRTVSTGQSLLAGFHEVLFKPRHRVMFLFAICLPSGQGL